MYGYTVMQLLSLADNGKDVTWEIFEEKATQEVFLDYLLETYGNELAGGTISLRNDKEELNKIFKNMVNTYSESDARRKYPINNSTLLLIVSMIPDFSQQKN